MICLAGFVLFIMSDYLGEMMAHHIPVLLQGVQIHLPVFALHRQCNPGLIQRLYGQLLRLFIPECLNSVFAVSQEAICGF